MTIDQEAENVAASVRHLLTQRGIDAREWERQAKQHEATIQGLRKELEGLRVERAELRWRARAVYRYVQTYKTTRDGDEARMAVGEELWAAGATDPDRLGGKEATHVDNI